LPILCRDLPVFREVAGQHATYFTGYEGSDLAAAIIHWLALKKGDAPTPSETMPWKSWEQSAQQMLEVLLHDRWDGTWMPGENYWFAASDPATRIGVGRRERDRIVCCGSSGMLLQTRTVTMPGGTYRLQVRGEWLMPGGEAHAEIRVGQQCSILADFELLKGPTSQGLLLDAELELAGHCADLEVWIVALGDVHLEIEGCGLRNEPVAARCADPYLRPSEATVVTTHTEPREKGRAAT